MIRVISSPHPQDDNESLPWIYSEDEFCYWVWEVLLAGYKDERIQIPSLNLAIQLACLKGYQIEEVSCAP